MTRPKSSQGFMERGLFTRPFLYRLKRFVIEQVIWRWILSGIFRLSPKPMPDVSEVVRGKRVLLAACGPGNVSTGPPVDAAQQVVAFDIAPEFVEACQRNRPEWKLCCGDVVQIPFGDRTFDVGVMYSALHHIPAEAARVLAELNRVTAGRILLVEGLVPERGLLRRALLIWYAIVDGGIHYYTRAELTDTFEHLGLKVETTGQYGPIRHMMLTVLTTAPERRKGAGATRRKGDTAAC